MWAFTVVVDFLGVNLAGLRDTQIASEVLFLGISMRMFPEEISIWIRELSKEEPHPDPPLCPLIQWG
jgi:hypothetical protein